MDQNDRIQQLEEWHKEDPKDPFLPYAIALEWCNQGHFERALNRLYQLCNTHPNYLPAFQMRGTILFEQNKLSDALSVLQQGLLLAKAENNAKATQEINELINQINYHED